MTYTGKLRSFVLRGATALFLAAAALFVYPHVDGGLYGQIDQSPRVTFCSCLADCLFGECACNGVTKCECGCAWNLKAVCKCEIG